MNLTAVNNEIDMSTYVLNIVNKLNILGILVVLVIGLFGNYLIISVFAQKRFRTNSSSVYLLSLAIIDSLYLVLHFMEDTIRTYKNTYSNEPIQTLDTLITSLNIVNRNDPACRIINYIRYVVRFASAFIIVAFTLQRLFLVYKPLKQVFKSKKSAWKTVVCILLISLTFNSWVPFLFTVQSALDQEVYCDNNKSLSREYFQVNLIYICLVMFMPVITILISNLLIIHKTKKEELNRLKLLNSDSITYRSRRVLAKRNLSDGSHSKLKSLHLKPYYFSLNTPLNKTESLNSSKKIVRTLIFVSFSYALLDLPYLTTWLVYFYGKNFAHISSSLDDYLYSALKLAEIFYVLNYGIKFFVYCASGSLFREHLKYSSKRLFYDT